MSSKRDSSVHKYFVQVGFQIKEQSMNSIIFLGQSENHLERTNSIPVLMTTRKITDSDVNIRKY